MDKSTDQPLHNQTYHVPVLFNEALEALNIQPDGVYVDCTLGGGGHSNGILKLLGPKGRLIVFDQDEDAKQNVPQDSRITFVPHNFRLLQRFLRLHKALPVNGVLADLGVSSHQFDTGSRGFSTRFNGPLDMRMDIRQEATAAKVLQTLSEAQLHKMFEQYGEVTNSKTLAKHIVDNRKATSLHDIEALKTMLHPVVKGNPNKYFAQVFQALRIVVNEEMEALKEMLQQIPEVLKPAGRAVIITFHSIEDRLVKTFFKNETFEEVADENPFSTETKRSTLKIITKKPVTAGDTELKQNPRSRSAKMRVAEKK